MKRNYLLYILLIITSTLSAQETNYNFDVKLETKKKEKLEESPYAIFGDNTQVLQTKHEEKKDHTLKIPIVENDNQIGLFKMDFQTGIISMEDTESNIFETKKLTKEQLARFTTMDPLAERYYAISPYAYVGNNPMNAIDPRGDSIWFTIENSIATMHVTAKIINKSSDNINMSRAANDIANGISDSFDGMFSVNGKSYSLKTDIQLNVANKMDDVLDSDHLFVLADKSENPIVEGARAATNQMGGKVITMLASDYANDNIVSNNFSYNKTRSAIHEFGHAANLSHESGGGARDNLMTQMRSGTNITSTQRAHIIYFYQQGYLNKGRNSFGTGRSKIPNFYYSPPGMGTIHINKIGFNYR